MRTAHSSLVLVLSNILYDARAGPLAAVSSQRPNWRTTAVTPPGRLQALAGALLLVSSLFAATTVVSPVSAAANSESFDVTTAAAQSDGSITVEGDVDSTGDVTFLLQDPADGDVATVTKTAASTDFSVTVDLGSAGFAGGDGTLDEGTVSVLVDEGSEFVTAEASDTFVVDDTKPSAGLDAPSDGAELTTQPTINGTASDDTAVASVDLVIQRTSDGNYYDGSSWVVSERTVTASGTTDWNYNAGAAGIGTDGGYEVTIQVTDTAGNTRETVVPQPNAELSEVDYTVDSTAPSISSTTITDATDGDGTVESGDAVDVSATLTDATSGVETVTVDASALGGSTTETLTHDTGDTYTTTFQVTTPTVGDGALDLTVSATDVFGNTATTTEQDALKLATAVADVASLSIEQEFVGIVRDDDRAVTVSASGINDSQGNTITGPTTVDLTVDGQTVGTATVTDGSFETTVDPVTGLSNDTALGDATLAIAEADGNAATATVELVHEARGLDTGYQVVGTPMPLAKDPVFEDVDDATTYDPTADGDQSEWVTPAIQQAGEGYYIEGGSDDARIGYVFDTGVDDGISARTLHDGFNLVGASVDLDTTTSHDVTTDLGGAVDVSGNDNVEVWIRDESITLDQSTDTSAYDEGDGTTDIAGFDAYFVYVGSGEEYRNVEIRPYDPADRD